ncbi:MAG: hypothetical protein ACK5JD_06210 [Mangrovibacterium sp.]
MKVEEIKIGVPVTFFQIKAEGTMYLPIQTFITSKPYTDDDGDIVCQVDKIKGGVLISHLERRDIIVNKS